MKSQFKFYPISSRPPIDRPQSTGGVLPLLPEAQSAIAELKQNLITRGEATALFGQARDDGLAAILGNLDQSAFGEPACPTLESKAAAFAVFRHEESSLQ
mgnify:FL=1